jgi:hypothetical protein
MINMYCDSTIKIIHSSIDTKGTKIFVETDNIPARIASYNKIIVNNKGEEVFGEMTIKFDKKYSINYGDYIRILKYKNIVFEMPDKKFILHKITRPNLFGSESWLKVWI